MVAVYRLRVESVRILGRQLERAGLFERSVIQSTNRDDEGEHVALRWELFGGSGEVSSFVDTGGSLDRIVHVVNSFLPSDHAFGFSALSGEPEPPQLFRVPEPLDSVSGALLCHRKFAQTWVDEPGLLLDMFALAWAADDVAVAEEAMDDVIALGPIAPVMICSVRSSGSRTACSRFGIFSRR